MRLSKIGEFGLIKSLRTLCKSTSKGIILGIGDDTAAVKTPASTILVTSDMLLEGVHFDLSFITFFQLGYKSLAINISDIFAMGGKPKYFLINLGIPRTCDSQDIKEIYRGILKIASKFRVDVIGGDTCASTNGLLLSGTLVGETDTIITRSGTKPGDSIFVTRTLGDSAMGLMLLKKMGRKIPIKTQITNLKIGDTEFASRDVLPLLKRHLMPEPVPLKKTLGITSMIDVSDGLLIDLSHICDESNVGAIIYEDKIPISTELANTAKNLDIDPVKLALRGGEDYVLLFTASTNIKISPGPGSGGGVNAIRIGEVIKKGRFLVDAKGRKRPFKAEGYEHFK